MENEGNAENRGNGITEKKKACGRERKEHMRYIESRSEIYIIY